MLVFYEQYTCYLQKLYELIESETIRVIDVFSAAYVDNHVNMAIDFSTNSNQA